MSFFVSFVTEVGLHVEERESRIFGGSPFDVECESVSRTSFFLLSGSTFVDWACDELWVSSAKTGMSSISGTHGNGTIPSFTRTRLKVSRVFRKVMQKPLEAGMRGNSGRIFSSATERITDFKRE